MGLIGHWPLNGDLLDYSANATPNTTTGTVTSETGGKIGSTYDFNAGYITMDSSGLDLHLNSTYAFWVKLDAYPTSRCGIMETAYGAEIALNISTSGQLQWYYGTSGSQTTPYWSWATPSGTVEVGKWVHIALVRSINKNKIFVYKNGVELNWATLSGLPVPTTNNILKIGYSYTGYLLGNLNDVRVYDHALSEKEIKELAKAKILHYTFNDFQEPTTNVAIEHGQTGTNPFSGDGGATNLGMVSTPTFRGRDVAKHTTGTSGNFYINGSADISTATNSTEWSSTFYIKREDGVAISTVGTYMYVNGNSNVNINGVVELVENGWYKVTRTRTGLVNGYVTLAGCYGLAGTTNYYIAAWQIEPKDHVTEFVEGSRDGTVRDVSGYGNDIPLEESSTPKWTEDSRLGGGAYNFNGINNHMTLFSAKTLATDSWSVSGRFNSNSIGSLQAIFNAGGYTSNSNWINILNSKLALWNHNVGVWHYANTTLLSNTWYHFVLRYDGAGQYEYFLDGQSDSGFPIMATTLDSMIIKGIGVYSDTNSRWFNGELDDLRVYSTHLSDADVLELYQTRAQLDNNGNLFLNEVNEQGYYDSALGANNLILNGDLNFGDNTNFTSTIYDATNNCFSYTSGSNSITSTEYIDYKGNGMDSWDEYSIECEIKGVNYASRYYYMLLFYDKNYRFINHWDVAHYTNTYTTLTTALTSGDDWVYLADTTNWFDAGTNLYDHRQSLSLWLTGTDEYPAYTYSVRHQSVKDIDKPGNRILLNATYSGPTLPIGSPACNSYAGSTYSYVAAINKLTSLTDWERSVGTVSTTPNTMMRYGTKYAKVGFLINRDAVGGTPTTLIKNLKLSNLTNPQPVSFSTNKPNLTEGGVYNTNELNELGVTDGLVNYWPLNGDAKDYGFNGNDGTVTGAVVSSGLKELAYDFAYTTDKIEIGAIGNLTNSFTLSCIFNSNNIANRQNLISRNGPYFLGLSSSKIWSGVYAGSTWVWPAGGTTLLSNTWYHACLTYDGVNAKVYVNAVLQSSLAQTGTVTSNGSLRFGYTTGGADAPMDGKIADVRIYNRALSIEEINIQYKYGLTNTGMQLAKNGTLYVNREINEGL